MPEPLRGPAPEELASYLEERLFWQQLGVSASPPLRLWPEQRIRRYRIVLAAVASWEAAESERAAAKATRAAAKGR